MPLPQPGDLAPDFSAQDQHGTTHRLADYHGRKVALYFYPKDDTSGCTAQACNLRDNYAALQAAGHDWMHACGAKGRCTTCRIVLVSGADALTPPTAAELRYRAANRFAYEGKLFRNLNLSAGLELRYHTPYKADN